MGSHLGATLANALYFLVYRMLILAYQTCILLTLC